MVFEGKKTSDDLAIFRPKTPLHNNFVSGLRSQGTCIFNYLVFTNICLGTIFFYWKREEWRLYFLAGFLTLYL
jgi:hypothetical protein